MAAVRCLRCGALFVTGSAYLHPGHSCVDSSELHGTTDCDTLEASSIVRRLRAVPVCEEQFTVADACGGEELVGGDASSRS